MLRDLMLWISETLFYLQGGEMLINTPWIFAWVVFWTLIIVSPIFFVTHVRQTRWAVWMFIIIFLPGLMIAISPGAIQSQMMQECETVEGVAATKRIDPTVITINQCRVKDNYYGDFGEWKIVGQAQ